MLWKQNTPPDSRKPEIHLLLRRTQRISGQEMESESNGQEEAVATQKLQIYSPSYSGVTPFWKGEAHTPKPPNIYTHLSKCSFFLWNECLCLQTSTRERPWSIGMFSTSYIRIGFVCDLALNLLLIRITLSTFPSSSSSSSNISSSRIGTTWGRNGAAISV